MDITCKCAIALPRFLAGVSRVLFYVSRASYILYRAAIPFSKSAIITFDPSQFRISSAHICFSVRDQSSLDMLRGSCGHVLLIESLSSSVKHLDSALIR